jgi:hypothetical protein
MCLRTGVAIRSPPRTPEAGNLPSTKAELLARELVGAGLHFADALGFLCAGGDLGVLLVASSEALCY